MGTYRASNIPCRCMPVSTQLRCGRPQAAGSLLVHDNGGGLRRHPCCCLRGRRGQEVALECLRGQKREVDLVEVSLVSSGTAEVGCGW
jgi:hypothetical protein